MRSLPTIPGRYASPFLRGVVPESPAARAGLRRGDLLVSAAGAPLATPDDLFDALDAAQDTLPVGYVRGTDELEATVDLR